MCRAYPPVPRRRFRCPSIPGKTYTGTVESSAQSVDPSTGTTLMQIIVDNPSGELMPGDYASIRLQATAATNMLSVPSSAVIFDAKGLSIATVGSNNRVLLKPVTIGRDLGAAIEIASGLGEHDRVIQNPPGRGRQRRPRARGHAAPRFLGRRRAAQEPQRPWLEPLPGPPRLLFCLAGARSRRAWKRPDVPTGAVYKELGPWTPGATGRSTASRQLVDAVRDAGNQ